MTSGSDRDRLLGPMEGHRHRPCPRSRQLVSWSDRELFTYGKIIVTREGKGEANLLRRENRDWHVVRNGEERRS